jgi:hypothetical protein
MNTRILSTVLALVLSAPLDATMAAPITYTEVVDTSTLAGTIGSFDFNFNPGPLSSQAATLQILDFSSDGVLLPSASTIGDVSGTLPGDLTFDNGTGFNDYFQEITFGSTMSFHIALSGDALVSPDGTSTSGSTFAFSLFSDSAGTLPTLTTDAATGFADVVVVNLDGSTTRTSFLPVTSVPEPSTRVLALLGLALLAGSRMMARKSRGSTSSDLRPLVS